MYDITGFGTGIHADETFTESGLLGSYLGSAAGCLLFFAATIVSTTPRLSKAVNKLFCPKTKNGRDSTTSSTGPTDETTDGNNAVIEPLTSQADVLLRMNGLQHTYFPGCCAGKDKKPVEVLQGVDLDVTRNSVLGLLGHNGCGKVGRWRGCFVRVFRCLLKH